MTDFSNLLRQGGVALEREATTQFGAAAENFVRGAINLPGSSAGSGLRGPQLDPGAKLTWDSTSYAAVLAGSLDVRPKLKFLFKVQFKFNPKYADLYPILKDPSNQEFTFMVKQVDRPKVQFEYEDDVNIYNFRTKALKRIRHSELTMTLMDDVGNRVFDFFRTLMFIYSPITGDVNSNGQVVNSRDGKINDWPNPRRFLTGSGMTFGAVGGSGDDVAHRSVINTAAGTVIDGIRLKQIFIDPSKREGMKDTAIKMTYFDFVNPRLVSFDFDDMSHESSDPSTLTMQFDYDWMEMSKHDGIDGSKGTGGPDYPFSVMSNALGGDNVTSVPADVLNPKNAADNRSSGIVPSILGKSNPFAQIIASTAARAAQQLSSDTINRAVRSVAGGGRFANSSLGRAFTGAASNVASSIGGSVSGLVSGLVSSGVSRGFSNISGGIGGLVDAARLEQSAAGIFSSVKSTSARASASLMRDSATLNPSPSRSVIYSQNFYGDTNAADDSNFVQPGET